MVKASLIVIGILLVFISFIALEVMIAPEQKSDIRMANSLCTAQVDVFGFTVPVGSLGQKLLGAEADCQKVHYYMLLIDYGWIGYALGGLLFILGLVIPSGKSRHYEDEHRASHHSGKGAKYCGECGSRLEGHEKHCPECGEKV